jgi:hypothetical protein
MSCLGELHNRLHGGLWHITRPDRIPAIMAAGSLLVEPNIDDADRWKTSRGREYFPFVRVIGGVSLFDFSSFDADIYDRTHPLSNWRAFVPYLQRWGGGVWLEIDRKTIADRLVSPDALVRRWDTGGHHRHTIMPRIEAAHIGDLPISALSSAFHTWAGGRQVREFDIGSFDHNDFDKIMREWEASCEADCL